MIKDVKRVIAVMDYVTPDNLDFTQLSSKDPTVTEALTERARFKQMHRD